MTNVTEIRLRLRAAGFSPLPVEGKAPHMPGWAEKFETSDEEIRLWPKTWHLATNTGILAKFTPGADIDIMDEAAANAVEALAREHFEEHGDILVRFGLPPKRLIPLRTDEPFTKMVRLFVAPNGDEHKIEILGDGQQWVAFGTHPDTGKPYGWHGGDLGTIKREDLPYVRREDMEKFLDAAVELLIREHGYRRADERPKKARKGDGQDTGGADDWGYLAENIHAGRDLHDSLRDLGGKLVTAGMGQGAAINLLRGVMQKSAAPHDDRWQARFDDIPRLVESAERPPQAPPSEGKDAGTLFDPWADYVVPAFPLDILPPAAHDFVTTRSVVMGCDPSALAMAVLSAFSGALDHRFVLKMMRHGDWSERPRLWVLIVGDPSVKKTPMFNAALRPLEQYQNHLWQRFEAEKRDYEAAMAAYAAVKAAGDKAAKEPTQPLPPLRLVVWDITVEKLADFLGRSSGRGLLGKRDEIAGWIGSMEKYGGSAKGAGADRALWLQAWDGGPYSVDRISRGETYIQNLSVSLIGGIQPNRLRELHGLTSDGLLQRFIPVMAGLSRLALDQQSDAEKYDLLVRELFFAKPQRLIMTDAALEVMEALRRELHDLEQVSGGLADGLQSFVGKLPGYAGSLALILHMAHDPNEGGLHAVEADIVKNVQRLILDFILPHAFEFYRTAESITDGDRLRKLASWIITSGKTRITASDLTSNVAELRGLTLFDLDKRVSPLVAAGWLDPVEPGLPLNRAWQVNPRVASQFTERAWAETARKSQLARLLKSSTTGEHVA
jgi:hypothetical protein